MMASKQVPSTPSVPAAAAPTTVKPAAGGTKKTVKGKKLGAGFFLGCFGLFAFLFVLFVILTVVSLQGNSNASFFKTLNIAPADVKGVLSNMVNMSFGLLSMILFIALVVAGFSRLLTKKEEKEKRKKQTLKVMVTGVLFLLEVIVWIYVSTLVANIQVSTDNKVQGDIQVYDTATDKEILTTTGLTAPVILRFDASKLAKRVKEGWSIVSYSWDLDGDTKFDDRTGPTVTWEYMEKGKNGGVYNTKMKLLVADPKGVISEQTFPLTVSIAVVKPNVVLKVDHETGEAPLTVKFDASGSTDPDGQNPKDVTYAWEFGPDANFDDGSEATFTKTYEAVGSYPMKLRVENRDHLYTVVEKTIVITGIRQDIPVAKIMTTESMGKAPLKVTFSGENSSSPTGKVVRYEWDFGDGGLPDKSMINSHTFTKAGNFTVTLKITDEGGKQATTTTVIQVEGLNYKPEVKLITDPKWVEKSGQKYIEGSVPLVVTFDASQSTDRDNDIVDYQWDFDGDGTFETRGAKPEAHTYYDQGEKLVQLKVVDSTNNEVTDKINVVVKYKPLEAIIKASPLSGAAPLTVSFDGSASRYNEGTIQQFQWDFNDGTSPKIYSGVIQYTFQKVGIYHVKLTVLTNDGKSASVTQDIIVSEVPLAARFTSNVKTGVAPLSVVFDPTPSTGKIVRYFWDFGDGVVSSERKPSHTFSTAGTYTVVLTIHSADNITNQYSDQINVQ